MTLRGVYSLTGFRAEADLMLWLVGPSADLLQRALVAFRRSTLGRALDPWWSAMGVHRDAEFSPEHRPAFLTGKPPARYVCVYPYVRSLEWYLLPGRGAPPAARRARAHGTRLPGGAGEHLAAFALGDYERLLAFEAQELELLVDLMRHLRGADARRHTRHELPFLTGIRKPLAELVNNLP